VPVFSRSTPRGPLWLTGPFVSIIEQDALSSFLHVLKAGQGVEATGTGLARSIAAVASNGGRRVDLGGDEHVAGRPGGSPPIRELRSREGNIAKLLSKTGQLLGGRRGLSRPVLADA
jgi:hypothetical protein